MYACVSLADPALDPEIICIDPATSKSAGYGPLLASDTSFVFSVSLGAARHLLTGKAPILKLLGQTYPFECAIGANGRVWIRAGNAESCILITRAIQELGLEMDEKQCKLRLKQLVQA